MCILVCGHALLAAVILEGRFRLECCASAIYTSRRESEEYASQQNPYAQRATSGSPPKTLRVVKGIHEDSIMRASHL